MWSLYEDSRSLNPLVFSNGKTQEDIVNEVIEAVKQNHKLIFIRGVCGTGKSAIALNLAKEFGRASIVVPLKSLQKQYEDDYTHKKYLLKKNGEKLKIKVITGRQNHLCPFQKEIFSEVDFKYKNIERNSRLNEFGKERIAKIEKTEDSSSDNNQLPCKIQIKEKNKEMIAKYLKKNPKIKRNEFFAINNVRRMSIAPVCPYWSPIVPSEIELNLEAEKRYYGGLGKRGYYIYQRKEGCGYYGQFNSYVDADTIIFNSHKYKLETLMNRKPDTDIEIIDECDEFLDSFSNEMSINLNRLSFALMSVFGKDERANSMINDMIDLTRDMIKDNNIEMHAYNRDVLPLKDTQLITLLEYFSDSSFIEAVDCDEESYVYYCDEVARTFKDFFDETYLSYEKEEETITIKIVTTNLEKRLKELLDKNKVIVMMSGTLHSDNVLRNIFGLSNFKIIEAETKIPGRITKLLTGNEFNCRYSNFRENTATREYYLNSLSKCIEKAKKPVLIHVNSFSDLPTEEEAERYNLDIITREKVIKMQSEDKTGEAVKEFKDGKTDYLFSTKCSRGVDFPGETCNSIILTKYPYPNVNSLFWKILKLTRPQHYNEFYMDKAKREFLQRIFRGLRSESDHIYLSSPDIRVFQNLNL